MRRAVFATVLAVAALGVAGCGGGNDQLSKPEFESQLGDILQPLQSTTLQNIVAISASDRESAVRQLKQGETKLHDAADDLASMKPPDDAVDPTQQLADGVDQIAGEVTTARKAAENGDFSKLVRFKLEIASDPAVAQIRDAAVKLINLGYNIAGTGP